MALMQYDGACVRPLSLGSTWPLDRWMPGKLIAQTRTEGLTIISADTAFDDYDVLVLDARE